MISNYLTKTIFAVALAAIPACAGPLVEYTFTGICSDCTGPVTGLLTLSDSGSTLSKSDFVSFAYGGSNLFPAYTINAGDPGLFVYGSIPSVLPATALVEIDGDGIYFYSDAAVSNSSDHGQWGTGYEGNVSADQGPTHQYSVAATTPEPTTVGMLGAALVGLVAFRRKLINAIR